MQVPAAPKYWFYDKVEYNHSSLTSLPNCEPASAAPITTNEDAGGASTAVIAGAVAGSVGGAGKAVGLDCMPNLKMQAVAPLPRALQARHPKQMLWLIYKRLPGGHNLTAV